MRSNPLLVLLSTLLAVGIFATAQARQSREPECPDCNVVLVSIDTLRADPCVSFRVFNPYEFFLLEADPAEQHNLFDEGAHRAEVARLRRQLDAILESRRKPTESKIEIDARTRERLRALGYVD